MSSIGATAMPRRAKMCQSYFMLWAIFSTPGSWSSGFSRASAAASSSWSGTRSSVSPGLALPSRSFSPSPSTGLTWPSGT